MGRIQAKMSERIRCQIKDNAEICPWYHSHDGYEIFIVLEGEARFLVEEQVYDLTEGSVVIINPLEYHRVDPILAGQCRRIVLQVRSDYMEELSSGETDLGECFNNRMPGEWNWLQLQEVDRHELLLLARMLLGAMREEGYGQDVMTKASLYPILVKLNRLYAESCADEEAVPRGNVVSPLVRGTVSYLEEHITENISLKTLSDTFYHNGTYISRCFKETMGVTIQQYIGMRRIELAKRYLRGNYTLTEVCRLSGFNDYSNFSRSFQRQVGCSPKRYQSLHAEKIV